MSLYFEKANKLKDFKAIHDYTIDAFSDTPDFNWTLEEIQKEVKDGWELWAAYSEEEEEIVAAIFYRKEGDTLLTKNSGLKIHHQGMGYSHEIKEYLEEVAEELGCKYIAHYCRIDNFRMYSLNESHGYTKTGNKLGDDEQVVEWIKEIK